MRQSRRRQAAALASSSCSSPGSAYSRSEASFSGIRKTVSQFGVSATLLGKTAVAASVEAEELARVALPARRGRSDVALANILGTVVHFIAFNAGLIALVQPLPLAHATTAGCTCRPRITTAALCALIGLRGGLGRVEGSLLLALYAAYVTLAVAGVPG